MDDQEEVQQNMISNLPLLFASGYPTSLDKITEPQLENFIPFMVRCSLGHINFQEKTDCSEPEWWPEDLPFTIPFTKPKKFTGNWVEKMKEIIIICYQFHKSVFLLRFCNDLAAYEHASLRFINNYNSTTSLFERRSNKLLVTFRNENMSYDQPQRSRKCLMRQKSKTGSHGRSDVEQMMVEPAPFDIYLCDNCDAELYSKEAILEHEKTCNVDDDDVILCDTPEPGDTVQQSDPQRNVEDNELRKVFLLNFNLQCRGESSKSNKVPSDPNSTSVDSKDKDGFMIIDRNKRMPRRNRAVHSLTRCPTIPLSSPAGQLLIRTTKTTITPEYLTERLERLERFCYAPILSKSVNKPKFFDKKYTSNNVHCTFKKPQDYSPHMYTFPRRQFSQKRRTENFLFLNSSLIKRCRPISVRLKKITESEVRNRRSLPNTKLNIKLTRDASRKSNWKISSPSAEIIVDTIDLCSSDEDDLGGSKSQKRNDIQHELSKKSGPNPKTSKGLLVDTCEKVNNIRINTSEISVIPIRKSLKSINKIKCDKLQTLVDKLPTNITDDSNKTSSYDRNAILPSSTLFTTESGITLQKPLQPSVYILSNYTTNAFNSAMPTTNEISSPSGNSFKNQNQENHVQNGSASGLVVVKHQISNNVAATITPDWYPDVGMLTTSSASGINSTKQNHKLETSRTSRSLPLVSSSRVISIDLTS